MRILRGRQFCFVTLSIVTLCFSPEVVAGDAAATATVQRRADLPVPVAGGHLFDIGHGSLMYAGGTTWIDGKKQWLDQALTYDLAGDVWSGTSNPPPPFGMSAVAQVRPDAWLLVGSHGPGGVSGQTTRLTKNMDELSWTPLQPAPFHKAAAVSGLIGNTWVIVGGADDNDSYAAGRTTVWIGQVDRADASVVDWSAANDFPGQAHAVAAGAVYADRLYLFGGLFVDEQGAVRDSAECWSFCLDTGWTQHASLPIACRGATAVAVEGHGIVVAGGWGSEGPLVQLLLYQPQSDAYATIGELPVPMAVSAGIAVDDGVYLAGNEDAARARGPQVLHIRLNPHGPEVKR